MPQDGVRSFLTNVWHYCNRCGRKTDLNVEMQWQYGMLLCEDCFDIYPVLIGAIEAQQARALETIVQSMDMRPHEKLIRPTEQIASDDIFV